MSTGVVDNKSNRGRGRPQLSYHKHVEHPPSGQAAEAWREARRRHRTCSKGRTTPPEDRELAGRHRSDRRGTGPCGVRWKVSEYAEIEITRCEIVSSVGTRLTVRVRYLSDTSNPHAVLGCRGRPLGLANAPSSRERSCRIGCTRMTLRHRRQLHRAGHDGDVDAGRAQARPARYGVPAKLTMPSPSAIRVTVSPRWRPGRAAAPEPGRSGPAGRA